MREKSGLSTRCAGPADPAGCGPAPAAARAVLLSGSHSAIATAAALNPAGRPREWVSGPEPWVTLLIVAPEGGTPSV